MKLSATEIQAQLAHAAGWSVVNDEIRKQFTWANFVAAMQFVNKVAELAEQHGHHPDILIQWNRVTLTLSTHDAGGLTTKDFDLAKAANAL